MRTVLFLFFLELPLALLDGLLALDGILLAFDRRLVCACRYFARCVASRSCSCQLLLPLLPQLLQLLSSVVCASLWARTWLASPRLPGITKKPARSIAPSPMIFFICPSYQSKNLNRSAAPSVIGSNLLVGNSDCRIGLGNRPQLPLSLAVNPSLPGPQALKVRTVGLKSNQQ